jgi:hypothetical protein
LSADDPEMENGWRCIPVPPTDDPRWFILDSSRDRKQSGHAWSALRPALIRNRLI